MVNATIVTRDGARTVLEVMSCLGISLPRGFCNWLPVLVLVLVPSRTERRQRCLVRLAWASGTHLGVVGGGGGGGGGVR